MKTNENHNSALSLIIALSAVPLLLSACRGDVLSLPGKKAVPENIGQEVAKTETDTSLLPATSDPFDKVERVASMPMVLAISWQPGFCENAQKKSECQSQRPDRFDARHFTLHGLWPQPGKRVYCNVSKQNKSRDRAGNWLDLPAVQTSVKTKQRLDVVMPGTRSALDRHEWIKHGTCYSKNAETYYRDSLALMASINTSGVQKLFAGNIGKELTSERIRKAFDQAFGRGTGKRVRVSCKRDGNRQLITEITLGLKGVVGANPDIGRLARASRSTHAGCPRGIVDAVGLQ